MSDSERPSGRLRAALRVLTGRAVVDEQLSAPDRQLRFEWREYQQVFDDILTKLSAQLARQARARKKEVAEVAQLAYLADPPERAVPDTRAARKADLNRRAAAARGIRGPARAVNGPMIHSDDEGEP